jgi:hypothetical protein
VSFFNNYLTGVLPPWLVRLFAWGTVKPYLGANCFDDRRYPWVLTDDLYPYTPTLGRMPGECATGPIAPGAAVSRPPDTETAVVRTWLAGMLGSLDTSILNLYPVSFSDGCTLPGVVCSPPPARRIV